MCKEMMYGPLPKRTERPVNTADIERYFGKGTLIRHHIQLILAYQKAPLLCGRYGTTASMRRARR